VQFWVDASEATDEEAKALLDGVFRFHPLAIEDCLTVSDRSKVDEYENYLFMVIHAVDFTGGVFNTYELNLFVGKNFLVTFHRQPLRCVQLTIDRMLRNAPTVARAPDRLTYTVLDFLLDGYAPALEELTREIAQLENTVLTNPAQEVLQDVLRLKGEVQRLRQIVWPQREVVARVAHGEFKIIRSHLLPYYRDLLDQLVRISNLSENARDSLTNVLQVHLNLQQMQVNRVIKVLTVMATLFMPILVVTSFYGMNFKHWPGFESRYAYPWVFGTTALSMAYLYWLLRRKGWW
jgi:magnesium transporter